MPILVWDNKLYDFKYVFVFPSFSSTTSTLNAGALVWAKLEGHPWWPCMVVPQPLTGQQMRGRGRDQRIHVHFFDEPPTRGWVSTKYIREYQGGLQLVPELMMTIIILKLWFNVLCPPDKLQDSFC